MPTTLVGKRYVLEERIGRGGAGVVWRARDEVLGRRVAVKSIALPVAMDHHAEEAARRRVLREARSAARLNHPSVVTVYDVVEEDGTVHIVMELVDAPTLSDRVKRDGPLGVEEAAKLGLALLEPLTAAHTAGIVHRDVKPSNVMVPPGRDPKLADFGIAAVQDDSQLTRTGLVVGSPPFMAPEQAEGHPTSPATDLWGLGATLYYAVEGVAPFERGQPVATLHAVIHDEPRPATRAGALGPVLDDLLAKDPNRRPTLEDLCRRLGEVANGRPAPETAAGVSAAPAAATRTIVDLREDEPRVHVEDERPVRPAVPSERPAPGGGRWIPAAIALVLVLLVGGLTLAARSGDEGTRELAGAPTETTVAAADEPAATSTSAAPRTTTTAAPAATSQGRVPAGWVRYTDPAVGYSIAHPEGWTVSRNGSRTDFRKPGSATYLRVDWVKPPGPSPEGAWEEFAPKFAAKHPGYQEIRIDPTTFRGWDAAEWEFTYPAGGGRAHAIDLGFVVPGYGFALNFQTADSQWEAEQETFEGFKAAFTPPPADRS